MKAIRLTDFQLDEVQALLDICDEEVVYAGRYDREPDRKPWGVTDGNLLTITDQDEAIGDLEDRAIFFIEEGPRHTGSNLAGEAEYRSLQSLIQKIEGRA